jgi:hypothetical protein
MKMGSNVFILFFFFIFFFLSLSSNPDYSEPIIKPGELPDELWKIIEPMVEVEVEKRKSPEEVC